MWGKHTHALCPVRTCTCTGQVTPSMETSGRCPGSPVNTCTNTFWAPGSAAGSVRMSSSSSLTASRFAYTAALGEVSRLATRCLDLGSSGSALTRGAIYVVCTWH